MKDHEIVLKRDRKLAEMKRSVNSLNLTNTGELEKKDLHFGLLHDILNYRKDRRGGTLWRRAKQ